MQSFKKAITVSVIFFLLTSLFTVGISEVLMNSEYYHCCDNGNRQRLQGKIDVLLTGASHGMNGFNTSVIDKELNCNSYNLSGPAMGFRSRYYLAKQEIERNPVNTVVIDITFNSMLKSQGKGGEVYALPRLYTFRERLNYFLTKVYLLDKTTLIGQMMHDGLYIIESKLIGENSLLGTKSNLNNVNYDAKGYRKGNPSDMTLLKNEIVNVHNSMTISTEYPEDNIYYLDKTVELCKEHNIKVIIAVVPISDNYIWKYTEWYKFHNYLNNYCVKNEVEFFDFNLLKERYKLFNDKTSFGDVMHMSEEGSIVFSKKMCETIKLSEKGEDISSLFYSSYEEMKADSPYMKYYLAHKDDV